MTIDEIFDACGGPAAVAVATKRTPPMPYNWRKKIGIPEPLWNTIIAAAKNHSGRIITPEDFHLANVTLWASLATN